MRFVKWLIIGCWLGFLLAGCGTTTVREDGCGAPAVLLEINDDDGRPLEGVTVRYRLDGGAWLEVPLLVNGSIILDAGPGRYLITAEKPGYRPDEASVTVPAAEAPDCGTGPQQAALTLAKVSCAAAAQPLVVTLLAPQPPADLQVEINSPGVGQQALACETDDSGACRQYTVPLSNAGSYTFRMTGLPQDGRLAVTNGVASYDYPPFEILLAQDMRREQISGEGAGEVRITLPVTLDEVGCPLVELEKMEAAADPDRATEPEDVSVNFLGNVLMTDLDAAGCEAAPQPLSLTYEVTVPAGTRLSDLSVQVRGGEAWETAECRLEGDRYLCTAVLPNPLVGQPYAARALIGGEAFVSTQIPFDNLCILFTPAATDDVD